MDLARPPEVQTDCDRVLRFLDLENRDDWEENRDRESLGGLEGHLDLDDSEHEPDWAIPVALERS